MFLFFPPIVLRATNNLIFYCLIKKILPLPRPIDIDNNMITEE